MHTLTDSHTQVYARAQVRAISVIRFLGLGGVTVD